MAEYYPNVENVSEAVYDMLDSVYLLDGCKKNMIVGHLNSHKKRTTKI